jgi:hypothetical protein
MIFGHKGGWNLPFGCHSERSEESSRFLPSVEMTITGEKGIKSQRVGTIKLGCLWQRLLSSPLKRGAGGVLRQTYTPLNPLFLEGNHKRLKFLYVKIMANISSRQVHVNRPCGTIFFPSSMQAINCLPTINSPWGLEMWVMISLLRGAILQSP